MSAPCIPRSVHCDNQKPCAMIHRGRHVPGPGKFCTSQVKFSILRPGLVNQSQEYTSMLARSDPDSQRSDLQE